MAKSDKLRNQTFLADKHALWEVGGQGLYIQPTHIEQFGYKLETDYDWGFSLKGIIHYTNKKNLSLQWLRYRQEDNHLQKPVDNYQSEGPTSIVYSYKSNFDIIYFQLSQDLDYEKLSFTLHGGLEYAVIKFRSIDSITSNTTQSFQSTDTLLRYDAVGPVLGIDLTYRYNNQIELYILQNIGVLLHEEDGFTRSIHRERSTGQTVNLNRVLNERDSGSTANGYFETGVTYKELIQDGHIDYQIGWITIAYNIRSFLWSGGYFGLKLVGNI